MQRKSEHLAGMENDAEIFGEISLRWLLGTPGTLMKKYFEDEKWMNLAQDLVRCWTILNSHSPLS
jgi:hypothetical protein